jgi:hypothetical protein
MRWRQIWRGYADTPLKGASTKTRLERYDLADMGRSTLRPYMTDVAG